MLDAVHQLGMLRRELGGDGVDQSAFPSPTHEQVVWLQTKELKYIAEAASVALNRKVSATERELLLNNLTIKLHFIQYLLEGAETNN